MPDLLGILPRMTDPVTLASLAFLAALLYSATGSADPEDSDLPDDA